MITATIQASQELFLNLSSIILALLDCHLQRYLALIIFVCFRYRPLADTFAQWLLDNAPATGFLTDSDNEGVPNGIENILGSNPNVFSSALTQISATTRSTTFLHALNPSIASNVTYSYQWSSDLKEWKASGQANTTGTTATIAAIGTGPVTVTTTIDSGPARKLFTRIAAAVN